MLYQERLTEKIQTLPPSLLPMVDVFVDFLLTRYQAEQATEDDLNAAELAKIAMAGGAFDWLNDPAEDGIYSDEDGEPV
ncbi:MAG: toxin-antitoxin system, antitoxin component, Xre family protein [Caldilinea sp. CFX5]|nr:toxin-antitoxin system, antitoxin component, Xre family protein [Caldilinea sp. CFX5]